MFKAPQGFTSKSTSGFVTVLAAKRSGLAAVLAETNARREHPGLAQHALQAIGDLVGPDLSEDQREEVILTALEAMRAHRNHVQIQVNGIRALSTVCSGSREVAAREGVTAAVIAALQMHGDTRDSGWRLLIDLGEYQSLAAADTGGDSTHELPAVDDDSIAHDQLVGCILQAMTMHLPRLNVQQCAVDTLCTVVSGTSESMGTDVADAQRIQAAEMLIGLRGIPIVLKALQTHAAQDELQAGGLRLVRLCCEGSERLTAFAGRAVAAHSGGIGALLDAMRGCVRQAPSLADGLVVMAAVALSSEEGHMAVVRAGGIRVAMQSIQCHESAATLQVKASALSLCVKCCNTLHATDLRAHHNCVRWSVASAISAHNT
jgi:hypothetical protein